VRGLVVVLAVLFVIPGTAQQRQSREQELANIRAEIGRLTARLEAARKAQTGLKGEMEAVEVDLRLQETRLSEAAAARDLAARRVEDGEREVQRMAGASTASISPLSPV
jgi:septal ring factor EnvC (AmiA/AmiB activator)